MSPPQLVGLCVFGFITTIGIVASIVKHETEKSKLGDPRPDDRDWQGAFMKDWKR